MYGENVDPENTRDFKECFDFAKDENEVSPFFGPNLMPENALCDLKRLPNVITPQWWI
jgi:hypothetical protein